MALKTVCPICEELRNLYVSRGRDLAAATGALWEAERIDPGGNHRDRIAVVDAVRQWQTRAKIALKEHRKEHPRKAKNPPLTPRRVA